MLIILFTQLLSFTSSLMRSTVKNSHSRIWLKYLDREYFLFLSSFMKEIVLICAKLPFFEVYPSYVWGEKLRWREMLIKKKKFLVQWISSTSF